MMNAEYDFLKQPIPLLWRGARRAGWQGNTHAVQITPHKAKPQCGAREEWGMMRHMLALVVLCVWVTCVHAQNIYVSSSATDDSGAGTSWETAKKTLAAGLAQPGGTVFVKAGAYSTDAELVIPQGKTVMGGYDPTSTGTDTSQRRLPGANLHWADTNWCTIVTGTGVHRIATVNGALDGCVIRHGFTSTYGGGVLIDGTNAVVRYCVLKECDAYNEDPDGTPAEGGGAYVRNGGTLLNCVVTECRGDKGAGAAGGNGSLISNTITRNRPTDCGVVADYDGNLYHTVVLGDQCWMRENLRTTRFADGTLIPEGTVCSSTDPYRYRGYVSENDHQADPSIFIRCGYLYNWAAVMHGAASSNANPSGVQGICPNGWHVPSNAEWDQLVNYVQSVPRYWCNGNNNNYGKALAAKTLWNDNNTTCNVGCQPSANNASLFGIYAVGYFNTSNYYSDWKAQAVFWTSSLYGSSAYYRYMFNYHNYLHSSYIDQRYGFSVRCVKD
ncbi:MAG: hypothetical protein II859_13480 [Bacteroidales bacterium]|nr:hypothetical protein [Bacteroidales bacterium]